MPSHPPSSHARYYHPATILFPPPQLKILYETLVGEFIQEISMLKSAPNFLGSAYEHSKDNPMGHLGSLGWGQDDQEAANGTQL